MQAPSWLPGPEGVGLLVYHTKTAVTLSRNSLSLIGKPAFASLRFTPIQKGPLCSEDLPGHFHSPPCSQFSVQADTDSTKPFPPFAGSWGTVFT